MNTVFTDGCYKVDGPVVCREDPRYKYVTSEVYGPACCPTPTPAPTPTPETSDNPEVCLDVGLGGGAGGGNFEPTRDGSSTPVDMGCTSPVLVDVAGDGFALTDFAGGVRFDLNGDGAIDARDAVFAQLRLWQDLNHDGVSQAEELHTLPALDVARLHLDYKDSRRVDGHGNRFRYRAKVDDARGAKAGRWAWDVFLVAGP